jgi:pimeloyl-ACP methyl ester carboxylesterase
VSLSVAAYYHGSGTLSYAATGLATGLSINSSNGLITGTLSNTADAGGPYSVTVTATDGTDSARQTFAWNISQRVTVDPIADQTSVPGDVISLPISAVTTSSASLSYSATGLPTGLSINGTTGIITGTITAAVSGTPYAVTITANDGTATAMQTFNWTIAPLTLASPGDQMTVGGSAVSLTLSADVASGYTASFSATDLPSGLSINTSTGLISGTLASADTGFAFAVDVTATAGGVTVNQAFNWTVGGVVVTTPADQTSTEGATVSVSVSAFTASGTLSYSASGLPFGLSINATTGTISGTITDSSTASGPFSVTVEASNGTLSDLATFNWVINPLVSVTAIANQANVEGDTVSLAVTASEPGATLTYSATGLPSGLSINSSSGVISGTVATGASLLGPFAVFVTVGDGTYSTEEYFNWIVAPATAPAAPTLANPGGQTNAAGDSVNLTLSAGDSAGYTLSFSATDLPDGLGIDQATGIISGTPTEDAISTMPYTVAVTADDGVGETTTQTFIWLVNDPLLTVTVGSLSATEGVDIGNTTVATFTDADPNWSAQDFTATVAWGDGSSDQGLVTGSNGSFSVTDDHVYKIPGSETFQVSIADFSGSGSTATTTIAVVPAPITVTPMTQGALIGTSISGEWAMFTDANASEAASAFAATISWGDGSSNTSGSVTGSDGDFIVTGSHTYSTIGAHTVTVTVTDAADGTSANGTGAAEVGNLVVGEQATLTVASFGDSTGTLSASLYTASINWGDNSGASSGTITASSGVFNVQGTHTYTQDSIDQTGGVYVVTVTITGPGGSILTTTQDVEVTRPLIAAFANEVAAEANVAFTDKQVATFTVPDSSDAASEFAARINWGDGTSSSGTVTGSAGLFQVLGGHTYTTAGTFAAQVVISQAWGEKAADEVVLLKVQVKGPVEPAKKPTAVVFLVHGVRDDGASWYGNFETALKAAWQQSGDSKQDVIGFHYQGKAKDALITLGQWINPNVGYVLSLLITKKTTIFAATTRLDDATPAVKEAAKQLADKIKVYHALHPNAPINLFGHSNGTMVILLALQQLTFKVDNVVLAASPYDTTWEANDVAMKEILETRANRIFAHFSMWDVVTANKIVNGGSPIKVTGIGNNDWSLFDFGAVGPLGHIYRTVAAHSRFTGTTGNWFKYYAEELAGK